jgi:hypothetical protein
MKQGLRFLLLALLTTPAFAQINYVECEADFDDARLMVNVERSYGNSFKRVEVILATQNDYETRSYFATSRVWGAGAFRKIQYRAAGFDLEIDLFGDSRPRWGRTYRAEVRESDLLDYDTVDLDCRFNVI